MSEKSSITISRKAYRGVDSSNPLPAESRWSESWHRLSLGPAESGGRGLRIENTMQIFFGTGMNVHAAQACYLKRVTFVGT